ncbi:MAG: hypothetical protein JWQ43_2072, partial [Glaciihabitans sp.]|nr:hypothetical protein [Glaciihabitans sp.]
QDRRHADLPWLLISMAAAIVVLVAFMVLPGWDAISHLLLLDRTTPNRAKIGLGLASFVIVPLIISYLDAARMRGSLTVSLLSAVLFGGSQVAIAFALLAWEPQTLNAAPFWQLYVVLGTLAVFFLARGYAGLAALAFLILTGMGSATVNPVYVGVYDLRETDVAKTVISMDATEDYAWVGIGDRLTTAVLLESGVQAYNGFQGAPSQEMWDQIDPDGEYEFEWNRLAGISWTPGQGDPVVTNPYPDAILATFDACDDFAQENVDYVLSDVVDITSDCLVPEKSFEVASGVLTIYEVTAPTAVPAG